MTFTTILTKKMSAFAAAHTLPSHDGGCYNLHGHNYGCEVSIIGAPLPGYAERPDASMLIDFSRIKEIYSKRVHDRLDHAMIFGNKLPKWYTTFVELFKDAQHANTVHSPKVHVDMLLGKVAHLPIEDTTAECLASWIYEQMAMGLIDMFKELPGHDRPEIYSVTVFETESASSTFFNPRYRPVSTDVIASNIRAMVLKVANEKAEHGE